MSVWNERKISGALLDITGVLYDSGPSGGVAIPGSIDAVKRGPPGGTVIPGSVEAVKRLKASGLPVRFCTNETTTTRKCLVEKLSKVGFDLKETEIFPPIPAICKILKQRNLRPYLIVTQECRPDFAEISQEDPNCVVIGDAESNFSYENLNKGFQLLKSLDNPILFSLGKGKYYKHGDKLVLDSGAFMKALEYACDVEAEVVGKPEKAFFQTAVEDMGITPETCIMVGDDIVSDVGGAQKAGMRGVQVRTGKYRPEDEKHPLVKADGVVDDLAQAVDLILSSISK